MHMKEFPVSDLSLNILMYTWQAALKATHIDEYVSPILLKEKWFTEWIDMAASWISHVKQRTIDLSNRQADLLSEFEFRARGGDLLRHPELWNLIRVWITRLVGSRY